MTSAVSSLTLRLTADGFVYLYDLSDEETEAGTREGYHTRRQSQFVPIDWSRVSALWGDIIAQHPILSDPEGEIRVLYPASHYVVIPSGMSGEQDVHWWRLTAPIFADEEQYYSDSYALGDGKPSLAVGFSHLLKGFLQRSFVACRFVPTILPFAQRVLRQSSLQTGLSLGVELVEGGCDLVLCQSGNLLRANHYSWPRYRSWQHHLYQVLYFLSKVYLDSSVDHSAPVSIILSDGTAGTDSLVGELLQALHRQFTTADWDVSVVPIDYWYA
ncbi:DUF3822 family protein [Porphyromonas sp.]|uniref:DUF3822 family protein n=1 Tax=Porphyromonas sp. TaxID=1924944 RepID=UPI003992EC89